MFALFANIADVFVRLGPAAAGAIDEGTRGYDVEDGLLEKSQIAPACRLSRDGETIWSSASIPSLRSDPQLPGPDSRNPLAEAKAGSRAHKRRTGVKPATSSLGHSWSGAWRTGIMPPR